MTSPRQDTLEQLAPGLQAGSARERVTRSLTVKQATVTVLVVALLGMIAGLVELYADWKAMRGEIHTQTERTLGLVRGSAAEAAYQFNDVLAAQVVDSLLESAEIEHAVLRDNFGNLIASGGPAERSGDGGLADRLFGDLTDHRVTLYYDVGSTSGSEVGELEIRLASDAIGASFMQRGAIIMIVGLVKALVISVLVVLIFYFMITRPLLNLHGAIARIDPTRPGHWPRPALKRHDDDELGQIVGALDRLMHAFQRGLEQRDQARDENTRLGAELDVSRRIQQILLPSRAELDAIETLDIATYMEPAQEVGGDYYDILSHAGGVRIGIGDVTGHGLESGIVMLMTQSAVRTLLTCREEDIVRVMEILNTTIYDNVQRMGCGKNLTLALLDYQPVAGATGRGRLRISGQHESVIIARRSGEMEIIDTDELGFPIGLVDQVSEFVSEIHLDLERDDLVVLYTDGITEAASESHELYGLERLTDVIARHHTESAEAIRDAIITDVKRHIGGQTLFDDLTLVILRQK